MISHSIPLHPLCAGTPLPTTRQTGSNHRWGRQDLARESVIELRLHTQLNLCPCNASMARRAARSAPISAIVTPKHQQYSNTLLHCDLFRQQSASSPSVNHVPPYRHCPVTALPDLTACCLHRRARMVAFHTARLVHLKV